MRLDRVRWAALACLALGLAGCAEIAALRNPEGDGGWSASRREAELARRSRAAGVDFAREAADSATPASSVRLDLAAALDLARRRNRRIGVAERDLETAAERVEQARAGLRPVALGSGRYTWYSDPLRNNLRDSPFPTPPGGEAPSIVIRDAEVGTLAGTLTVPVDLSGEIRHALGAAQAGYRGEKARLWATTIGEELAVVSAYFRLLEAERLRGVTEQTIALDREQLQNAQSRFDSGRLTKNQLLVVQVAVRNAEQELRVRDLAIAEARYALNQAIGADVHAPTEVVDRDELPPLVVLDEALRATYEGNPVLVSLVEEQQRIEAERRSLERGWLPRVSGGGGVDYSQSDLVSPKDVTSGFVGFTWDLGTDGRRLSQIAAARIATDRNRLEIERQLRELEAAVRTTHQSLDERLGALATAEVAVEQAEENLRIRRQQFDAGRATSEDVLDAEQLLAAQSASRASALYQAWVRRAELESLMGRSPGETDSSTR